MDKSSQETPKMDKNRKSLDFVNISVIVSHEKPWFFPYLAWREHMAHGTWQQLHLRLQTAITSLETQASEIEKLEKRVKKLQDAMGAT